jgi:hypothetical protein
MPEAASSRAFFLLQESMMQTIKTIFLGALGALAVSSCTWVAPDEEGQAVRVAYSSDDIAPCARLGEISVSVKASVGFVDRSETKVRDELESLARNEGATMGATHVYPVEDPVDGSQRFEAFDCR